MFRCMMCQNVVTKPYGKWSCGMTCGASCNDAHIAYLRKALHEREAAEAGRVAKQPAFQVGHDSEGAY